MKPENGVLLGNYAATGNSLSTFRDKLSGPIFNKLEEGTDRLSRNVVNELPLAAKLPRRTQLFSTSRRKPEISQEENLSKITIDD